MSRFERVTLVGLVLACLIEGAIRKWLLPQQLQAVGYFAKDCFALLFVLSRLSSGCVSRTQRLTMRVCLIAIVLVPATALGLGGPLVGVVLTFKNAVLWPLVGVVLATSVDERSLDRACPYLCGFALFSVALGSAQALSSTDAVINRYAWDAYNSADKSTFGASNLVRASGTFSYLSGLSHFAGVSFLFFLWRFFASHQRATRWICGVGSIAALGCALTTGSRAPVANAVVGLCCGIAVRRRIGTLLQLGALIGVAFAGASLFFDTSIMTAYLERSQTAGDDPKDRMLGEGSRFIEMIAEAPFGHGLGTSSQATNFEAGMMTTAEDARVRLVSEAGFLGAVVWVLTVSIVVFLATKTLVKRLPAASFGLGIIGAPALYAVTAGLWFDHVATSLWWILIGVWASSLYAGATNFDVRTRPIRWRIASSVPTGDRSA